MFSYKLLKRGTIWMCWGELHILMYLYLSLSWLGYFMKFITFWSVLFKTWLLQQICCWYTHGEVLLMNEYENNTLVMMRVDMGISSLEFFKVIHCMADFSCAELQYVIQVKKKYHLSCLIKVIKLCFLCLRQDIYILIMRIFLCVGIFFNDIA